MPGNADAASVVALLAAVGAMIRRAGPAALCGSWLRAWNRRSVARLHAHAITEACASVRNSPVSVEIDHEERPECISLRLRLNRTASPAATGCCNE
jgi:hypothetical protein